MGGKEHSHKKLYWICGSCSAISTLISLCAIAIATSRVGKTEFDPSGFYGWVTAALSLLVAVLVVFLAFNYFYQEEKLKKIIDERAVDIINENNIEAKRYIDSIQVTNYWNTVIVNLKNKQMDEAKINLEMTIAFLKSTKDETQFKMSRCITRELCCKHLAFTEKERNSLLDCIYELGNVDARDWLIDYFRV